MAKGKKPAQKPAKLAAYEAQAKREGFVAVERGEILKWADLGEGYELEGIFLGLKPGKFDKPLARFRTEEGPITIGCPTILASKLEECVAGEMLRVVCLGKVDVEGQANPAWDFAVYRKPHSAS